MTSCLFLLFVLIGIGASEDPCDVTATSTVPEQQLIYLSSCSAPFSSESALLSSIKEDLVESCDDDDLSTIHNGDAACLALGRGWTEAANLLALAATDAGRMRIRRFAEARRQHANALLPLLQADSEAVLLPSCQWAQNSSTIVIAVRYSPKSSGPAYAASVVDPNIVLRPRHFTFSAEGRSVNSGKMLRFQLDLPLASDIIPDASSWNAATPRRMTIFLAKATPGERWDSLVSPPDGQDSGQLRRAGPIIASFELAKILKESNSSWL